MSYAGHGRRAPPRLQASFTAVARIPKPAIAAVTGYALGGGCELALCCDLRVARRQRQARASPRSCSAIIPGAGGTQRLPRLVGPAKAKDLIFTGRFVDAEEALRDRPGRPGRRRPTRSTRPRARSRGGSPRGPALALRAAKEAIDRGLEVDLDTGLRDRAAAVRRRCSPPRTATIGMDVVRRARPGQGRVRGAMSVTPSAEPTAERGRARPGPTPSWPTCSTTTGKPATYDEKWSISYDERCIDYARDRFAARRRARDGWPYGEALELGCGTGFFLLNLKQAGVLDEGHVTDICAGHGRGRGAQRRGARLRRRGPGRRRRVAARTTTRPSTSSSGTPCCTTSPTSSSRCARCCACCKPGGRFVFAGEPTDARRLVRAQARRSSTWWATTRVTQLPPAARQVGAAGRGARRVVARGGAGGGRRPAHLRPATSWRRTVPAGRRGRRAHRRPRS